MAGYFPHGKIDLQNGQEEPFVDFEAREFIDQEELEDTSLMDSKTLEWLIKNGQLHPELKTAFDGMRGRERYESSGFESNIADGILSRL